MEGMVRRLSQFGLPLTRNHDGVSQKDPVQIAYHEDIAQLVRILRGERGAAT